jgi:hypothetical protein
VPLSDASIHPVRSQVVQRSIIIRVAVMNVWVEAEQMSTMLYSMYTEPVNR